MRVPIALIALAPCLLISCGKEIAELSDSVKQLTVIAAIDREPETRNAITDISNNTVKIEWTASDAINLFFGESVSSKFVTDESGEVAKFKGYIDVAVGGGEGLTDDTSLWGVYPYKSTTTCDGTYVYYKLQSEQKAAENTFAKELFPTVFTNGLSITYYKESSHAAWSISKTVTLRRNVFSKLTDKDRGLTFEPGSGGGDDGKAYTDLSASGTANCYLVQNAGDYKFKAVQGNTDGTVGNVKSVEVLWESFGTTTMPNVGDLIDTVSYRDGYIRFSTPDTFAEGNAVIAAKNSKGVILWSWHIWCATEGWNEQVYYNGAGTMMDRNLGATSAAAGEVGSLGLFYQWGRKDPSLGAERNFNRHINQPARPSVFSSKIMNSPPLYGKKRVS